MKIYANGNIIPAADSFIPTSDHGFLFGISLFETFRTFNGKPFLLEDHLHRLQTSCNAFAISLQNRLASPKSISSEILPLFQNLLKINNLTDAVFRWTITAGSPANNETGPCYPNPGEFIFVRPLPPSPPTDGISLHLLKVKRREPEFFPRPKSGNFAENILALQELQSRNPAPNDEGLLLTRDGRIAEGIHSNFFLIKNNTLLTPSPTSAILEGITRKTVLGLAAKSSIKSAETDLFPADLETCDAIFMTNSVRGLLPVSTVFDHSNIPLRKMHSPKNEIFLKLAAAYRSLHG